MQCKPRLVVLTLCTILLAGCNEPEPYTLYRNSLILPDSRIHWATFDAKGMSEFYNLEHCRQVVEYLEGDPEVAGLKFWCEPGRYEK